MGHDHIAVRVIPLQGGAPTQESLHAVPAPPGLDDNSSRPGQLVASVALYRGAQRRRNGGVAAAQLRRVGDVRGVAGRVVRHVVQMGLLNWCQVIMAGAGDRLADGEERLRNPAHALVSFSAIKAWAASGNSETVGPCNYGLRVFRNEGFATDQRKVGFTYKGIQRRSTYVFPTDPPVQFSLRMLTCCCIFRCPNCERILEASGSIVMPTPSCSPALMPFDSKVWDSTRIQPNDTHTGDGWGHATARAWIMFTC